jgi:hypothetical protein
MISQGVFQRIWSTGVDPLDSGTCGMWCLKRDSNPRPTVYKTVALPTELFRHVGRVGLEPTTLGLKGRCSTD